MSRRIPSIALVAAFLMAACGSGDLDSLLECNNNESIDSAFVAARAPSAQEAANLAFELVVNPPPEETRADGGAYVALADGRSIAATEPVTRDGSFDVTEVRTCRSQ